MLSEIKIQPYLNKDRCFGAEPWDEFIQQSWNGTFLHSRRFLNYHKDRFQDASVWVCDSNNKPLGVFPAALLNNKVLSHPGVTFGGLIHSGKISALNITEIYQRILNYFKSEGAEFLGVRATPSLFHRIPSEEDLFAFKKLGFNLTDCELSTVVDLAYQPRLTKGRMCELKKAAKNDLEIHSSRQYLKKFWELLSDRLEMRYKTKPVHSYEEIELLCELFPNNIECIIVESGMSLKRMVAGIILFHHDQSAHVQYMAINELGQEMGALDFLIQSLIEREKKKQKRFFSMGVSTIPQSTTGQINEGLFFYKSSFRGGAVCFNRYEIQL